MLPELREPRIPCVSVQPQFQEIIIEWPDLWRLQLYRDSPVGFHLITFNDFISVCPSITKKMWGLGWGERKTKISKIELWVMHERSSSARSKVCLSQYCYPSITFLCRVENCRIIASCLFFTILKVMMKMMTVTITRTNHWACTSHQVLCYSLLLSQMFSK